VPTPTTAPATGASAGAAASPSPASSPSPAAGAGTLISPSASPSTGAPGASPSPSPAAGGDSYTIAEGDTLASIADKFYGDSSLWRRIYDANRQAIGDNPDNVRVGTTLRIPPR